ncbi:hypothetical protein M0R45_036231 [Rubus argutus]|uniref:Uncharacterized protein n=1 Tax=Rubus argutus TaxID=59490 RepID=A0AAW1VZP4_RUBAR
MRTPMGDDCAGEEAGLGWEAARRRRGQKRSAATTWYGGGWRLMKRARVNGNGDEIAELPWVWLELVEARVFFVLL